MGSDPISRGFCGR